MRVSRLAYLLAALISLLLWLAFMGCGWSSGDYRIGFLQDPGKAGLVLVCAFLPYCLLFMLARRFGDDADGLLLWWMLATPVVLIALFLTGTYAIPAALAENQRSWDPWYGDLLRLLLGGLGKYGLILAVIYGYSGHLLLKLSAARSAGVAR
jgi:hypothetical protein